MDGKKQVTYRSYIVSPFHNISCVVFSIYAMFFVCGLGPDGENVTVFNSSECFTTPRYLHIWAVFNSCGYFYVDFIYMCFIVAEHTALDVQLYVHHLITIGSFYLTVVLMSFQLVFGVIMLFIEVSTSFNSIRWMMYVHHLSDSVWYAVNTVLFAIFFLGARILYMSYIIFALGLPNLIDFFKQSGNKWFEYTIMIQGVVAVSMAMLINFYWMYLIGH